MFKVTHFKTLLLKFTVPILSCPLGGRIHQFVKITMICSLLQSQGLIHVSLPSQLQIVGLQGCKENKGVLPLLVPDDGQHPWDDP